MGIIIKPIITEKITRISDKLNRYGFKVQKNANKIDIKRSIEDIYKVTVEKVNTMIVRPKQKRRSTKNGVTTGKTAAFKKAIVTVKEGDKIDFYSNI